MKHFPLLWIFIVRNFGSKEPYFNITYVIRGYKLNAATLSYERFVDFKFWIGILKKVRF